MHFQGKTVVMNDNMDNHTSWGEEWAVKNSYISFEGNKEIDSPTLEHIPKATS